MRNAALGLSGGNRNNVAQRPHALKERVQTRGINAVIIGYDNFQMTLSFGALDATLARQSEFKPASRRYRHQARGLAWALKFDF
jgi:hypothetical protein